MGDILYVFVVLVLLIIIVFMAIYIYMREEQYQEEKNKMMAAILAKDVHEYKVAATTDRPVAPQLNLNPDEIDLANADDETFDKFIENQVK